MVPFSTTSRGASQYGASDVRRAVSRAGPASSRRLALALPERFTLPAEMRPSIVTETSDLSKTAVISACARGPRKAARFPDTGRALASIRRLASSAPFSSLPERKTLSLPSTVRRASPRPSFRSPAAVAAKTAEAPRGSRSRCANTPPAGAAASMVISKAEFRSRRIFASIRSPAPSRGEISSWASIEPFRSLRKRAEIADADAAPATPSARNSRSMVACPRRTSHGSLPVFARSLRNGRRRTFTSETVSCVRSTVRDSSASGDQVRSTDSAENQTPEASRISIEPAESEDSGSPSRFRTLRRP